MFIIAFSVVNIAMDVINNNIKTYGNAILFIVIVLFFMIFMYREDAKGAVENSLFIKLLKNIFTIDDGGEQWW